MPDHQPKKILGAKFGPRQDRNSSTDPFKCLDFSFQMGRFDVMPL